MPVYNDTTQDMLLARDGMALGTFAGGSTTTFPGIRMGELWVRIQAFTFSLGLGPATQQAISIVLAALSLSLFDRGVRRHFGQDIGWSPSAILLVLVLAAVVYPIATQGYLGVPAVVGSMLAFLYVVTSGSTAAACVAGASLAFAAELHPSELLAVPIFVLVVAVSAHRPIRALCLGSASGIAAGLTMSFHGWVNNAKTLLHTPYAIPLVLGALAIAIMTAALGRRRWLSLEVERRCFVLLIAIVGSVVGATVLASIIMQRMLVMPHYLLFAAPSLSILIALALRRLRRFGRSGRVVAQAIPIMLLSLHLSYVAAWRFGFATGTPSVPDYSMREAEILARHFWQRGYSFPDLQRHLRGPESLELLGGLAVFAPNADATPNRPMADLRLIAFTERNRPDGPIPAGGEEVDLGYGRRAWILPLDGWVRLAPSRVCFEPVSPAETEPDCVDIESDSIAYTGRYWALHNRVFPALHEARGRLHSTPGVGPGRRFTWELPIEITADDEERHIEIVGLIGVAPWVIARVDGVAYRGALPARHVVVERGGGHSGRLVLEAAPSGLQLRDYPPDFLETRPGETTLRTSLQHLPPLGRLVCEPLGTCPASESRVP